MSCQARPRQFQPAYEAFKNPERVEITGYAGDAMEPFLTRDGRYLLFNNRNDPSVDTNIYFAERVDDLHFVFRGEVRGANSKALDGVPSVSRDGTMVFVSTRSYDTTASTLYWGHFKDGAATGIELIPGVSRGLPGWVNFDAEISADGNSLVAVDSEFGPDHQPKSAALFLARRQAKGFRRVPTSEDPFANVNGNGLVYAPAESADQLELYFTKVVSTSAGEPPQVWRADRKSVREPFSAPRLVAAITGFSEGPTVAPDGRSLYYHHRDGDHYAIYRVTR